MTLRYKLTGILGVLICALSLLARVERTDGLDGFFSQPNIVLIEPPYAWLVWFGLPLLFFKSRGLKRLGAILILLGGVLTIMFFASFFV